MVRLHVKHGEQSQFLYDTTVQVDVSVLVDELLHLYNGRLKIERICSEMEYLAKHGTLLPYNMQGLTDEQIIELKLKDEWAERCIPSGGATFCKDDIGRRNGQAPSTKMAEVLIKTINEAKANINKKLVDANSVMTKEIIKDTLNELRGAVTIVYPMGLPPHDPIKMEFDGEEDLSGTQASLSVIPADQGSLWWAAKEMQLNKKLSDYVGKNEKTKIVVKLQKRGTGPPGREPVVTEDEKKQMMLQAYRRQEDLKKLQEVEDDNHLNSQWADSNMLKRQFQGLNNISWRPGKNM
nr:cilia- and flagella-associated protein 298-like [Ciona intestinalis]|eukprot:XP_002127537.1 cilia- and flagella-associated protein 298-like [Ciona intestinalis]